MMSTASEDPQDVSCPTAESEEDVDGFCSKHGWACHGTAQYQERKVTL